MRIQKLPAEAISKLQSGVFMTDVVQCVLELVHNALDAEATGVAVRIDLKNFQIKVIDNGKGIARDDLEFVGERFMTSKYQSFNNPDTSFPIYGFKGQAISSLLDVCKSLKIETKSENDGPTFIKVFQNNQALSIIEGKNERQGTGTTVTVEDFMSNMPVRRNRINEVFDNEEIKTQLQNLAIIHYNVCFTLRNENKGLILLQTCQASTTLEAIANIFGSSTAKSLKPLIYSDKNYKITGYISVKPRNQNLQLVYVNKRFITKGVIHKFVNNVMKEYGEDKSLFGDLPVEEGPILKRLRCSSSNVFVLQINCPHSCYELFTNLRKTTVEFRNWRDVLKSVHKAIKRAFKPGDKSLDSSSNSGENKTKNIEGQGVKQKFGTSLLVNAVRGVPVKRTFSKKTQIRKEKKKKENENFIPFSENVDNNKVQNCKTPEVALKSFSVDSLESPIPKNRFKSSNIARTVQKNIPDSPSQSFIDFYEWVKAKFKTDINACNLYNDFLQSKNKEGVEAVKYNSPVLIRNEKRSKVSKKVENKKPRISPEHLKGNEIATVPEKQLKMLAEHDLRIKKAAQFFTENSTHMSSGLNASKLRLNPLNFENRDCRQIFKQPPALPLPVLIQRSHLPSPASSEVQFTNIIKFRNSSESFVQQSSKTQRELHPEHEISSVATCTWTSHYQDRVLGDLEVYGNRQTLGSYRRKHFAYNKSKENLNLEFEIPTRPPMNKYLRERVKVQDVGIQVNMLGRKRTISAAVQTCGSDIMCSTRLEEVCVIPESPSFENGRILMNDNVGFGFPKGQQSIFENNFSQEVPAPDFWNNSTPKEVLESNILEIGKSIKSNEKNSTCSALVCCGQNTNSGVPSEIGGTTSKETQTHAALWPESLFEMGNSNSLIGCSSHNTKSDNTQLPKTIPLEELECNFTAPVNSGFALSERHDFVPKGLSPKCLNVEAPNIISLSPREKNRIKLTIDNAENELLAAVKWQDESTGSFIKPTIPDGILCEMREKAERNMINHRNQILSASLSYCAIKIHNLLHSFAFTKELLAGVEVLGQLDKKFIVTKLKISTPKKMELISLFDQHAVDERIRLEQLINDYVSPDGKFISSSINPSVECTLGESHVRVISDLEEKMENVGLKIQILNANTVSFLSIPTFMFNKHEKDVKNGRAKSLEKILQDLVLNIAEEITETRGAGSKMPKIIHNAFCLEACHGAIKFNRLLTYETMTEMINKLRDCKLPFQCAHGRPSVIPIIDLEDFKPKSEDIDIQKLKQFFKERKCESGNQ